MCGWAVDWVREWVDDWVVKCVVVPPPLEARRQARSSPGQRRCEGAWRAVEQCNGHWAVGAMTDSSRSAGGSLVRAHEAGQ